ncbi:phosphoserine phosphatase SerB [Komagataeibacter nataicola]|uniref:Phosphoserine phosphatase n=1 Tax=Komagataeibacter nataicola TaxID=265960 RepID=A0A9N7C849_9PROT|nr:phosphoserine phosphatase SerB [Komagataeibacter nataicola]AQU87538.1 phosphoserine phosphatase SerB [Komagataeibacter nataicola]PYD67089.1 phosphoserine phosphatase SerB [Komagataeibacter nataicola]WEQ55272.1 phosphoserine phosphatase SerB [Komagataeibacter nataicola]WNM09848.1 phosphoserine phosphatase SerB [Komagataeibacter nataicola]GBR16855.1 phosphoserine phosphatase [Komagataeibacter nataicola NRIC 0616]
MADSPSHAHILVLVANRDATSLTPVDIEAARDLAGAATPVTLAEGEAVEMACTAPDISALRAVFAKAHIDVLVTPSTNRRKRVLVADMDSTIVSCETLDDIAAHAGIGEKIAEITRRSMNGEIEFEAALRERVALLRGLPVTLLEKAWKDVKLNTGAAELVRTMRAGGARTALVSGGFTFFTSRVAALCGFDENHANTLLDAGDSLTGEVGQPILGPDAKLAHLRRLVAAQGVGVADALATGDGANDLAMLRVAGLGIAFHAKPAVRREIGNQVNATTLRSLLFAQGYRAAEFITA